jgi:hypothetical protein
MALNPVFGFGVAHSLAHSPPPFVSGRGERFFAGNAEGKTLAACGYQFSHGVAVAGDDHRLAFLHQFEEPGKLRLRLMHVELAVILLLPCLN